jgi:hypothetical protein
VQQLGEPTTAPLF